ncbi:MAG: hypothetical protein JNL01_01710 [Bdellovibrionales bacterium]|nr:hypothetical protein [Bdellovibrionales bacterium]
MKSFSKSFVGMVGLAALTGMTLDWALIPKDAEARICLFGGKKCRAKKADELARKGQSECEKNPNGAKCGRLQKRLGRVLNRKNMSGYRKAHGLNEVSSDMRSNMMIQNRIKKQCEMAGIPASSAECAARLKNYNGFKASTTPTNTNVGTTGQANLSGHNNLIGNGSTTGFRQ